MPMTDRRTEPHVATALKRWEMECKFVDLLFTYEVSCGLLLGI